MEKLEAFKSAFLTSDRTKVDETWADLERIRDHLQSSDWRRCQQIFDFSEAATTHQQITEIDFSTWPDSWAGALILAYESKELSQETTFRYIRTFPADQLSRTGEERFRDFVANLNLPQPQPHEWPLPTKLPVGYTTNSPKSIIELGLFPGFTTNNLKERNHLFSEAQWFWREHPAYNTIKLSSKSALIYGEPGCGRTALALGLTRYAEGEERVLGCLHSRPATLSDAQRNLTWELLRFLRWRSTWLTKLTQEDRDLLALVVANSLDVRCVLSALSTFEPDQFISDDANKEIWKEQAITELRLLKQAIEQIREKHPLPPAQWFEALSQCTRKMGFQRLRIALDLTAEQYETWHTAHLWQILAALPSNLETLVQLIVLVPGQAKNFNVGAVGMDIQELEWGSSLDNHEPLLVQMLRHRLMQRISNSDETTITQFVPEGIQRELCKVAHYNPRRLARLWQRIATTNPDAKRVTPEMVQNAETATP